MSRRKISDFLAGSLQGGGAGATIGSAFSPVGTAIGGGVGLALGGLSGLLSDPGDNLTDDQKRQIALGNTLTEEQIKEMKLKNRQDRERKATLGTMSNLLGSRFAGARMSQGLPVSQKLGVA